MNILMLLNATYPPLDIRVVKESTSLIDAGHDVTLLCLRGKGEKKEDEINGLKIFRIEAGKTINHLAFWDVVMSLTFVHPVFKKALSKYLKEHKTDAIHVHDLPLAGTALRFQKKNLKIVVDLHENYADGLKIWTKWNKNPIAQLKNKLFLRPEKWEKYESIACRKADAVIAVVDEMKDRLVRSHEIDDKKIFVVPNTENRKFAQQPITKDVYSSFNGKFIIAYTGSIGSHRGVDTVIDAMQFLRDKDIVFVVIGTGSKDAMENLNNQVHALDLGKQVHLLGHKPFNMVFSYMSQADVNVIPHKINPQNEHGAPHKLFQSMMASKPVLVSSSAPLKRFVTESKSGLIFKAEDPKDCAEKILELYNDPELCQQLGANGFVASTGKLSWEKTSEELLRIYK